VSGRAWARAVVRSPGWGGELVELGSAQTRVLDVLMRELGERRTWRQLPTVRELAARAGVNVGTFARTARRLARLGIVDLATWRGRLGRILARMTRRTWRSRSSRRAPWRAGGIVADAQLALGLALPYSEPVTARAARGPSSIGDVLAGLLS
jgi:hypothetical protein